MSGALLPWNPKWYRSGESLWSVANKIAFVACCSLEQVLEHLAGVVRQMRETWLFPEARNAKAICEGLQLPFDTARGMVAGWTGLPGLEERPCWQLAIRYCPLCLAGCLHRTEFQHRSAKDCPVHQCALTDRCPHCWSPIDPLCQQAWTCNDCGQALVEPGAGFLARFRTGPSGLLRPVPCAGFATGFPAAPDFHVDRRLAVQHVFEEHAALTSVLLRQHLGCAERERDAMASRGHSSFFDCPLAAAMLMAATQLGINAQCNHGGWVPSKAHTSQACALQHLEVLLSATPTADQEQVARQLARAWVYEALLAFVAAVGAGTDLAVWRPSPNPLLNEATGQFRPPVKDAEVWKLQAVAARGCRSKVTA